MIIPIRLAPVELHIHADRWLAFEVPSAFGARQDDGGSSAVLKDEGERKFVEFHTLLSTPRRQKTYRGARAEEPTVSRAVPSRPFLAWIIHERTVSVAPTAGNGP